MTDTPVQTMTTQRYIYDFDEPASGRELLGGKGAGLAEMTALGFPVPKGFTITTEACRDVIAAGGEFPAGLWDEVEEHVARLEDSTGKQFGAADRLLVSVRSGAAVSMPGMMDTVLNLGHSRAAVEQMGGSRFALDSYRRLVQMYGEVVEGIDAHRFEDSLAALKRERGVKNDVELDAEDLRALVGRFEAIYAHEVGDEFPQDARIQLERAVRAVFASWQNPRAQVYRRLNGIADDLGTAVNIVQMVFGNRSENSGTGVCFTRDPSTGRRAPYGEFLENAQGEDVVAGIRTPEPLAALERDFPRVYEHLVVLMTRLERHYRDVQDIEFTVEDGQLYLLQTRTAKRSAIAAIRCAAEMVGEGLITREEAIKRIDPNHLDQLLHPRIRADAKPEVIGQGLNASPGAAAGVVVFDAETAAQRAAAGTRVILLRTETTPDDIEGMALSAGVLTARGGLTSHAAVVARGMGKPCIVGCEALDIDLANRLAHLGGHVLGEADWITIDGGTGRIMLGALPLAPAALTNELRTILGWADATRRLRVRANADTPDDARRARELGAEGIGLCRTEHMFMAEDRLLIVREMILADTEEGRRAALDRLLPLQQADFEGIFKAMAGLPVTIRLLDPPLHEFLPSLEEAPDERARRRIRSLSEANPMLGTRGCRLGLQHPEIYEMQVRAIVRAAAAVPVAQVEIMHPLVGFPEELRRLRELTERVVSEEATGLEYLCGTMIELPRACVRADEIAAHADFFSFGTNDLTQTTLGFSRDDAEGKFLSVYLERGILEHNPFERLDRGGVGELMRIAVERGRGAKAGIKLGICGEHGGEPSSVAFCHELGLDYVSCSPYRVPLARLAAAQAALHDRGSPYVPSGG